MHKHKRYLGSIVAVAVALLLMPAAALAASSGSGTTGSSTTGSSQKSTSSSATSSSAAVTQSFGTSSTVQKGMIVGLDPKDSTKVEPLDWNASQDMYGVVVAANDAALTLTSNQSSRQVYVATFGKYSTLVSTQNGPISVGDWVSIGNINGVGMKADSAEKTVLGKALTAFNGSSDVEGTATLSSTDGSKRQVSLGQITVQVGVQANPLQSVGFPGVVTVFLTRIGYSVANKNVSPARLYLAVLVLLIASVVSAILLFSAVRNSMIAIGRNPLAKRAIIRGLLQVVIASLIIFIIGVFAVYLLLKL